MKIYLILIFILQFFVTNAQKSNQVIESDRLEEYDTKLTDVQIKSGKPIFVVVYISSSNPNELLMAEREIKELKKNFKNAYVYFLNKAGKLKIDNLERKTFDFDESNQDYKSIIYWNGKKESQIVEYENLIKSSEFFSESLNLKQTSSYINEFQARKDSIKSQMIWNPDKNSKNLSDKYIKNFIFQQMKVIEDHAEFLNFDFKGVKKLKINSNLKGVGNPWQEIYFDNNGYPEKAEITSDNSDAAKGNIKFEYKDDLISKIIISFKGQDDNEPYVTAIDYYYFNGRLIENHNVIKFYYLNNDFLNFKSFYFYEENFEMLIDTFGFKEPNNLEYVQSGNLNNFKLTFNKKNDFFPITKILRPKSDNLIKTLLKISNLSFVEKSGKFDILKINYLNEKLIKEVLFIDPDDLKKDKKINKKFDFIYEYYK